MVVQSVKIASAIPKTRMRVPSQEPITSRLEPPDLPLELPDPELGDPKEQVFVLNEVTEKPRFIQKLAPSYPQIALEAKKRGIVWLEAIIGVDGIAGNIRVVQSLGYGCDEVAVEALRGSRFAPAIHSGKKVAVRVNIPYRFSLDE